MKKLRNLLAVIAIGTAFAGGAHLYAQGADDDSSDPTPDLGVPTETQSTLSSDEMEAKSKEFMDQSEGHRRRIEHLKGEARKQKDVIKLNCINDKLVQTKQLLNILDDSLAKLAVALATGDDPERYHRFTVVSISSEKIATLRDEAEACVGEELSYLGPLDVDVDEPDVPDDPTAEDPFEGGEGTIDPPGYASPFE